MRSGPSSNIQDSAQRDNLDSRFGIPTRDSPDHLLVIWLLSPANGIERTPPWKSLVYSMIYVKPSNVLAYKFYRLLMKYVQSGDLHTFITIL